MQSVLVNTGTVPQPRKVTSALPPKADIFSGCIDVR